MYLINKIKIIKVNTIYVLKKKKKLKITLKTKFHKLLE